MDFNYISFNPLRSIGIPSVKYLKPEKMFEEIESLKQARMVLFPEYWQVNILEYALKKRIFPSSATYRLGHDKIEMTRSLMALNPNCIPKTRFLAARSASYNDIVKEFGTPFVCKEIANSCGMGVFLVKSIDDFTAYLRKNDVLYIQEYLPIERDLRVVIIGQKAVAAYWRVKPQGTFHNNLAKGATVERDQIPHDVVAWVSDVARQLGVDHAGFDIAITDRGVFIFEFNLFFGTKGIPFNLASLGGHIVDYLQKEELMASPLLN